MRTQQFKLFNHANIKREFGGALLVGRRKSMRPLSTREPIHLVLRSENKLAFKAFSFRSHLNKKLLISVARQFHIHIYESVFNFNHAHLVIQIPSREAYNGFIRLFTARLAKLVHLKKGELFKLRPYTRLLSWGREMKSIYNYMKKNYVEAIGHIEIQPSEIPPDSETS